MKGPGTVYLLHFERPLAHARHYMGYSEDLPARLEGHRKGLGARLMAAVARAGIGFVVSRTWEGGRDEERRLKGYRNNRRRGSLARLCPICKREKGGIKRHEDEE